MQIVVRKAKIAEVREIAELQRKLASYHRNFDPKFHTFDKNAKKIWIRFAKRQIRSKNGMLLVAVDKNKIIGYALGLIKNTPPVRKIKKFGVVSDVFVEKNFRNKGIARKFVEELLKWFKLKKLSYVELGVDSKNKLGFKVWNKFGFREYRKVMKKDI